jgi:Uma2 family endonuclease
MNLLLLLAVPEYWIVDYLDIGGREYIGKTKRTTITICTLVEDKYQNGAGVPLFGSISALNKTLVSG